MGVYLSRCLVRNEERMNSCFNILGDRFSILGDRSPSSGINLFEMDPFALLNQFLTTRPCSSDTFTVPTFMKYRILEDFVLFLQQRRIKLCANYTNESRHSS